MTADKISQFLVELACARRAHIPFAPDESFEIDLRAHDKGDIRREICFAMAPASAFGSILSFEDGRSSLWKQRITHNTLKYLKPIIEEHQNSANGRIVGTIGYLVIVCHMICSGNLRSVSAPNKDFLARIIVQNLVSGPLYDEELLKLPLANEMTRLKKLVLASILKLCCEIPDVVSFFFFVFS